MKFTGLDNYPDLKATLQDVDKKFLYNSRKRLNNESKNNSKILVSLNKGTFELRKDLLILAGTIFGSSIALAAGRSVNIYFIIGELFLFISIMSGLVLLLADLKSEEWDYAFSSKNSLELYLSLNRDKIEKFELDSTENLINSYKKIINTNQQGFLYFLLKKISLDKWSLFYILSFLISILLILVSIIPATPTNLSVPTSHQIIQDTPMPTKSFDVPLH